MTSSARGGLAGGGSAAGAAVSGELWRAGAGAARHSERHSRTNDTAGEYSGSDASPGSVGIGSAFDAGFLDFCPTPYFSPTRAFLRGFRKTISESIFSRLRLFYYCIFQRLSI